MQEDNRKLTPEERAQKLLQERELLRQHLASLAEMKERVSRYEEKFGLSSNHIHQAIDNGDLVETDEVCDWILTFEALQMSDVITTGR